MSQNAPWWIAAVALSLGCQTPAAQTPGEIEAERRRGAVEAALKPEAGEVERTRAQLEREREMLDEASEGLEAREEALEERAEALEEERDRHMEQIDEGAEAHEEMQRELQEASEARIEAEREDREAAEVEQRLSKATRATDLALDRQLAKPDMPVREAP
jgi:chromosome segregation ATPase